MNMHIFKLNKVLALYLILFISFSKGLRTYTKNDMNKFRDEVKEMFYHAYESYLKFAYPYDELRPLSCDGVDTYGSYSLTLIDALDTLAIMGNYTEFQRVVDILTTKENFDANINVSVFETNIRIIGGLLSAHLLSNKAGIKVEPGWPCNGPLLRLAEDVAKRLIVAFDTPTGMPYGTINLNNGIPPGETTVTCTAGIGTFILEFGALSRLTGDPLYEEVAMNAIYSLFSYKSQIGLFGNHIDVATGRWTAQDAGIGSGVDSFFEYLVKGSILLQKPELMELFYEARKGIDKYLKRDDWYLWVSMTKGQVTIPVFQSLEAFWPGVLSLIGETSNAMKTLHNYHQVWAQYGFTPEFYNIPQTEAGNNRENYPLRPELIESVMYLYRATGDPYLIQVGVDILRSIQHSAKTPCGYATIKDVRDHRKEDRMESFFLAETTKYLYLLFDTDNFIHNPGQHGTVIQTPSGECIVDAGGYLFNTEAHPIDPSALHCCHDVPKQKLYDFSDLLAKQDVFRGVSVQKIKTKAAEKALSSEAVDEDVTKIEITGVPTVVVSKITDENIITTESSNSYKLDDNDSFNVKMDKEFDDNVENISTTLFREDVNEKSSLAPSFLEKVMPATPERKFDLQELLEKIRSKSNFTQSITSSYRLLSCKAQPFLQKMSIFGEFFNK